jgi:glycogen synthase
MRILMTTDTVGGVWTFTKQLTMDLLKRGHEVALVSFGRAPSASQLAWSEVTRSSSSGFSYFPSEAPLEWMQENAEVYQLCAPLLLSVADELQPDVLLSSQFCFGKLPVSIPRIIVAHSDVLSWARACRTAPLPSTPWLRQYIQLVSEGLDGANAVVAPTHWMLTALAASFTLPQNAVVILNGRTLPVSSAQRQPRALRAVTAGRLWDEAKNLSILQKIDPPMPIFVAGSSELESSQAPPEHSRINLLGELDESELLNLFGGSAAYICTSLYEPFGLAPVEAALCGCAVVANDIPSLREVWKDCASFFHDERTLLAVLQQLTNPQLLETAQARSQARAEMYTSSRMTERYLNLFERLLRCSSQARSSHAA